MDLENLNFKAKDVVQYVLFIISLTAFFISMSAKVDNVTEALEDLKSEKKEAAGESRTSSIITQNDIKALTIRAELNRQSIDIMKSDIEMLKQYQTQNN